MPSCPSLHKLGVMNPKRGVVFSLRRSCARWPVGEGVAVCAEGPERDDVGVAFGRVVDDRMEPDEGVVPRRVLVGRCGDLGRVGGTDARVSAVRATGRVRRTAVPCWRVAHVLLVGAPGGHMCRLVQRVLRVELRRDRLHRRGIHAALAVHLPRVGHLVRVSRARHDVGEGEAVVRAVRLGVLRRGLTGHLGDVVVEAVVAGGVVVLQQLALRPQGAVEIGGRGAWPESGVVALVFEFDHEDVIDLPGSQRARGRRWGTWPLLSRPRDDTGQGDDAGGCEQMDDVRARSSEREGLGHGRRA